MNKDGWMTLNELGWMNEYEWMNKYGWMDEDGLNE